MNEREIIDTTETDLDTLLDLDASTDVYASERWLDEIEANIPPNHGGGYDPDTYPEDREWLIDELTRLFIRAHREADIDILDFCGALMAVDENVKTATAIALDDYARSEGYHTAFGLSSPDGSDNDGLRGELEDGE